MDTSAAEAVAHRSRGDSERRRPPRPAAGGRVRAGGGRLTPVVPAAGVVHGHTTPAGRDFVIVSESLGHHRLDLAARHRRPSVGNQSPGSRATEAAALPAKSPTILLHRRPAAVATMQRRAVKLVRLHGDNNHDSLHSVTMTYSVYTTVAARHVGGILYVAAMYLQTFVYVEVQFGAKIPPLLKTIMPHALSWYGFVDACVVHSVTRLLELFCHDFVFVSCVNSIILDSSWSTYKL